MKKNKGFSLIEVLVTLVLTAVGVLGMFVLQSKSISYTQDTVHREQAISATNELVEIMRVYRDELYENIPPRELVASDVRGSYGEFYSQLRSATPFYTSAGSANFTAADCLSPQTASDVAGCWLTRNATILPNLQVSQICPSVSQDSCANSNFTGSSLLVRLTWEGRDSACVNDVGVEVDCTYSVRVEL